MEKTVTQKTINWRAAAAAAHAAQCKAEELGVMMSAVVMDRGGNVIASLRDPRVPLHTFSIASNKATTSAAFGMRSAQLGEFIGSMESHALTTGFPLTERMVLFGGGVPIYDGEELVGGIGVSGGSEEQDEACAEAGVLAIGFSVKP